MSSSVGVAVALAFTTLATIVCARTIVVGTRRRHQRSEAFGTTLQDAADAAEAQQARAADEALRRFVESIDRIAGAIVVDLDRQPGRADAYAAIHSWLSWVVAPHSRNRLPLWDTSRFRDEPAWRHRHLPPGIIALVTTYGDDELFYRLETLQTDLAAWIRRGYWGDGGYPSLEPFDSVVELLRLIAVDVHRDRGRRSGVIGRPPGRFEILLSLPPPAFGAGAGEWRSNVRDAYFRGRPPLEELGLPADPLAALAQLTDRLGR